MNILVFTVHQVRVVAVKPVNSRECQIYRTGKTVILTMKAKVSMEHK